MARQRPIQGGFAGLSYLSTNGLDIIRKQSVTVTCQSRGGHAMAKKELSPYAPDRWIRELNRRYPNIWVDLRKGFNEPNTFLSRQPKAQEMLGKVPDWCIMPTFFPGIIMMARYGDEYYFTHMDEIMTIASRSSPAIQSSRGC